ncbi:MAG: hypothetical protein HZT41_00445 [Dechloromonas sp.]|nr:MAG: hypothetical protein HZT41_00445 [Dechloromonas sp.]
MDEFVFDVADLQDAAGGEGGQKFLMMALMRGFWPPGVGNVFEEDEAEDKVLVFSHVHVVAQVVGTEPELGLEADRSGGFVIPGSRFRHQIAFFLVTVLRGGPDTISSAF